MQKGEDGVPLSPEELKAIRALKRLAKKWPRSIYLFAANGTLNVLRKLPDGGASMTGPQGGADPTAIVVTIEGIDCDGGDW